ncbi:MAG: hypothetical protein KAY50_03750 [Chitinophagaceae bacterium]|mgnify:CR=1 FL=1|nr:hypothetical protein [Chitinophagaceae bacterium]
MQKIIDNINFQSDKVEYWAAGSSFGGTRDQTETFIENGIWQDGWGKSGDDKNKQILSLIKKGDYLFMKSSATHGVGHKISFTKLKAIGEVIGKIKDNYYTFRVKWYVNNLPKNFDGIWYSNTIEPMRDDEMLKYGKSIILTLK